MLLVLNSILLSLSYFAIYKYAYKKGHEEFTNINEDDKVIINKENSKSFKGLKDFIEYNGGE